MNGRCCRVAVRSSSRTFRSAIRTEGRSFERFNLKIEPGTEGRACRPLGLRKSTLISLIQRLDDPQDGGVFIDGQRITEVGQDSLRSRIAVVPQEIALFHRSIMENIRYGKPDATDEEVISAARHAYCDGFIQDLPDRYHTMVGERGCCCRVGSVSGWHRAGVPENAPILILDEATSALDTQSEWRSSSRLRNWCADGPCWRWRTAFRR